MGEKSPLIRTCRYSKPSFRRERPKSSYRGSLKLKVPAHFWQLSDNTLTVYPLWRYFNNVSTPGRKIGFPSVGLMFTKADWSLYAESRITETLHVGVRISLISVKVDLFASSRVVFGDSTCTGRDELILAYKHDKRAQKRSLLLFSRSPFRLNIPLI